MLFIFFDILWLIMCDIVICFNFEWLFVMQLLVSSEFYIKKIYLFVFSYFFLILIKSDKQVDTTDPFKWVVLELKNLDPFNKYVGLVLTYIVEYLWVDITRTRHVNTNCHSYPILPFQKVTLSIIPYHFTILLESQLLFYNTTR